jgi:hypothetical protein
METSVEIQTFRVVSPVTSIDDAIKRMRADRRSALVVEHGPQYSLVEAPEVVFASADGTHTTLNGLLTRTPLEFVPLPPGPLDFRNQNLRSAVETHMDQTGVRFALLAVTYDKAVVASRSETDMEPAEASPRDCYCKTDRGEVLPGTHYGDCPRGHYGTVRCC